MYSIFLKASRMLAILKKNKYHCLKPQTSHLMSEKKKNTNVGGGESRTKDTEIPGVIYLSNMTYIVKRRE